jgi:two-component system chemotaxis response regulator CheY
MSELNILIVDDSPTMRRICANTLKRAGFENYTEATDGKDALTKLQDSKFGLVITDVNMPFMDAIGLVTAMRANETLQGVPVLLVTTRSTPLPEECIQAMGAGANGYILKPYNPDTLLAKIREIIPR